MNPQFVFTFAPDFGASTLTVALPVPTTRLVWLFSCGHRAPERRANAIGLTTLHSLVTENGRRVEHLIAPVSLAFYMAANNRRAREVLDELVTPFADVHSMAVVEVAASLISARRVSLRLVCHDEEPILVEVRGWFDAPPVNGRRDADACSRSMEGGEA